MYAASFVGTLRRVDSILDRALSLQSFRAEPLALDIADEALLLVDELGELTSATLPNAGLDGHEPAAGDDAIESILATRFAEGLDTELDPDLIDAARESDRIDVVNETAFVPLDGSMPRARNVWLLVDAVLGWLDGIRAGFSRTHQRASVNGSDTVETAYWTVLDGLEALEEVFEGVKAFSRYVEKALDRHRTNLVSAVADITTTMTEDVDA